MKLNRLLLMSVMGLGLFACNNNDLVEGTSGQDGTQSEGTTYVGFTLKFNDANTRATETGTEGEQKISSAYVMMTSDGGTTFEEVLSMGNTPKDGKGEGYYSDQEKFLFQTNAGNHDFYAVINPDEPPVQGGNISAYFKTAIALPLSTITTDNNFMMSSHEIKTFYVNDNVTEQQALTGTANSFTIDVERVVAKVTMTCDSETLTNSANEAGGGTIDGTTFTLKNKAGQSYRMAQTSIQEITDNKYSDDVTGTTVYVKQDGQENIHKLATPVYCLENLHTSYYQKNTTYVDIETTFTPAKVVKCLDQLDVTPDNNLKNNSTTGSFFVVRSGEHAQNYLMKSDLLAWQKSKEYVENQSNEISKNPDHFPAGVESISEEYVNGKCFFGPIWIGQETADASTAPVTRNTWYNLKITGIKLPGEPHAPEIDETGTTPLVPPTNVAITLTVMPWNFINREIDLQ